LHQAGNLVRNYATPRMNLVLQEHPQSLDAVVFMKDIYLKCFRLLGCAMATDVNMKALFAMVIDKKYKRPVSIQLHPDKVGPGTWPLAGCRAASHVYSRSAMRCC